MVKQQVATKEEEKPLVAAGVPQSLAKYARTAGEARGISTDADDNLTPYARVLQPLSPQVNKRNAEYIEGAEPGCILLNNALHPIVNGEEGIVFQPCYFSKSVNEWIDRDAGGGLVARYSYGPGEKIQELAARLGASEVKDPKNPNRTKFVMPNNNELVEVREFSGYVHGQGPVPLPYVISFQRSGHAVARSWNHQMNQKKRIAVNQELDVWLQRWHLVTKVRSNAQGEWFEFEPRDSGWFEEDGVIELGLMLYESFKSGERSVEGSQGGEAVRELADDGEI